MRVQSVGITSQATTITVSDCSAPSGAAGRLVEVVAAAPAGAAIDFSCSGTITLTATITIDKNLTIDGVGQSIAISGGDAVRVFTVSAGVTFYLENLSVTHGLASGSSSGGGVNNAGGTLHVTNATFSSNSASHWGGGIYSSGTLTVAASTFSGNSANSVGGGIANEDGTLSVTNSIFARNSAPYGGGIYNFTHTGTLSVTNSTFSDNSAPYGGGMENVLGTANVTNSTFSGNGGTSGGGIRIVVGATMNLKNSIVASTRSGSNCSGVITDGGGNLQFGGTLANSCGATISTGDPVLSPLANNGGPTQTMAPGIGSAALDAADYATCIAAAGAPNFGAGGLDQRGQPRASLGSVCDIGAFEIQLAPPPTLTVSDCSTPGGAAGRLVEVVTAAAAGATVNFSCSGTITLTATITIDKNLTINGAGQSVTLSGGDAVRVLTVSSGVTFYLQNLSVTHGIAGGSARGGGIYNTGGALHVTNTTFSGNYAGDGGGGIYSTGALTVVDSTFSGNSAYYGGAIVNESDGILAVVNSTFSGNSAYSGGGGIYNTGTLTVTNSTFTGNSASGGLNGSGGGIHNAGMLTIINSTFSGNSAGPNFGDAGNIHGPATLKNTIVANAIAGANCNGTITDGGGNLQFGGAVPNSCGASIPIGDPKINPLADNGGSTRTMALGIGSAALDAADYVTCMAAVGAPNYGAGGLDQRGQSRASLDSVCDIGAFEGAPVPTPSLMVSDCSAPSGAAGRLVEVVTAAAAGNTIVFSCSGTITLTTTITINKNLTIDGAGQDVTISGGNTVRVFTVNTGRTFNLQNLNVTQGASPGNGNSGGGVDNSGTLNVTKVTFSGNSASYAGGGIYSTGTLNVTNSIFSGNSVGGGFGGGIAIFNGTSTVTNSTFSGNSGGYGGGISNWSGTSTVINSTFSGNSGVYGGGLYNAATLNVINSTFSGNTTYGGHGGGMYELGGHPATVTNSTFSDNSAGAGGTGGIYGPVTLKNTIVADSTPWNCQGAVTDGGGNLQFGGTVADSCGATIPTADPKLSALADHGGSTQTMALLPDSPALNAANPANCPVTDQRGVERGSSCDIGAYEYLGIATGTVYPAAGGTVAMADGAFSITFPPNAVTTPIAVTFTQVLTPSQPLPTGRMGLRYFTLEARDGEGTLVSNFNQPYTMILTYTDEELTALSVAESSLNVSFWNGAAWVNMLPCAGCNIDTVNNRVTVVANHFTFFMLSGLSNDAMPRIFLPLIVK